MADLKPLRLPDGTHAVRVQGAVARGAKLEVQGVEYTVEAVLSSLMRNGRRYTICRLKDYEHRVEQREQRAKHAKRERVEDSGTLIAFRLPGALLESAKAAAAEQGITLSAWLRNATRAALGRR